ncbi:MAG: DUF134 domain-containing protein [Oscillospiraceae bacterium]|nr:DUF134 domain-containing protein [Oscillospiraceae bacterium]
MARPFRCRRISRFPDYWTFYAGDSETDEQIILSIDEYETIRMIDLEKKTQEECSVSMGVSRTTVTAIYDSARKKVARFLTEGKQLRISGGEYKLVTDYETSVEEKGKNSMRIAVTYDNGMIGQHFGHTEEFKLYDVEDGAIVKEQTLSAGGRGHGMLAGVLKEAKTDLLICGGIGNGAKNALSEAGIELIPGTEGSADETVIAYLNGTLIYDLNSECHDHDHEEGHDCGHDHGCEGNKCGC